MRALSGLTPALSRRLQRQLLRHLPPHAARSLRRTLSLGADRSEPADDPREAPADDDAHSREPPDTEIDDDVPRASASQFYTLPRLRRRSSASREPASPSSPLADDCTYKMAAPRDSSGSRPESRGATDRPLLSKYLSERTTSLDDTYASDGGSLVTDPSYIAAYGSPAYGNSTGPNFRRHSLRLSGDRPKKRISRFLRSDFFESPPDESVYTKHKKEKELETQKILKEIREKRSRASDGAATTPADVSEGQNYISEDVTRKCLSPTSILVGKDRSRSTTPFFPSLDNIKENAIDSSTLLKTKNICNETRDSQIRNINENATNQETRIVRPKSYPAKSIKTYETNKTDSERKSTKEIESENKHITSRESKLLRPKSYPNNSNILNKTISNRTTSKDECKSSTLNENHSPTPEGKTDVEVSFNITLPRKTKPTPTSNSSEVVTQSENLNAREDKTKIDNGSSNLVLKKYKVVNSTQREMSSAVDQNTLNESILDTTDALRKRNYPNSIKNNISSNGFTRDNSIPKDESKEEKKIVKKKVIKKVPSKSKTTELGNDKKPNDIKSSNDKKIVAKKHKEKSPEDSKQNNVIKKKSVLQSIGHKLEKLTSSKSNSPEKICQNSSVKASKKETSKLRRTQREHSVPVEPPTESNLIKRAVTVTDVAALENQSSTQNKTTVSKVLGLFKKFEPKEKQVKLNSENSRNNVDEQSISAQIESDIEKPQRPSSLLLNGVSRKSNKYNKTSSDSCTALPTDDDEKLTKKEETKSIRSTLKLDFSKLPRVKKIVPTNPVIEPQIMDTSMDKGKVGKSETNGDCIADGMAKLDLGDTLSRSRSRSRSIYSNSDVKSDYSAEIKEKTLISPSSLYPIRSHDSTTPEKEDVGDRIRRKSFYSRFNEKKQRRKSNLVGPGAVEYDPVARIYSHSTDKYDASPTSPNTYDVSPGFSVSSDASPSTDRYRSSLADLARNNLRYDSLNDKVDTYRSLDRSDLRKYSGTRSYLDYDQPSSYGQNRYSRTKSLLETSDGSDNLGLSLLKEPHKYNRTNSLYAPGSYATYRPKRTQLNSAIILKESEKEPSPENILEKIRNRKYSIRVTRKSDPDKESTSRPAGSPQGEGDGAERSEKGD